MSTLQKAAAALLLAACGSAQQQQQIAVVNMTSASAIPLPVVLAVQVCAGLMNRNASGDAAYTLMQPEDIRWFSLLVPGTPLRTTPIADFLASCISPSSPAPPPARGWIRYNYSSQQQLVPNLLTLAAVLDAIPLEAGSPYLPAGGAPLIFDATTAWANFSELNATAYMYNFHAGNTSGLSKMNPGWDENADPASPKLTRQPDLGLADYIVKERLFNFYLTNGCINGTADHELMETIASANPWPRPLAVLGYDDTWPIAGDVFEAETLCVKEHNMGQIATSGVNNLAFFSRTPSIRTPLRQNASPRHIFNASRTYIGFVLGDGDNVAFVKSSRFDWFQQRVALCASGAGCFPLGWSISPHLTWLAPGMLSWYFNRSAVTGADYFVLPPSGHLYAYPSLMQPADQATFVSLTEADCTLLNSSASVAWEFVSTWGAAIAEYFPRYSPRSIVKSLFAVNVPYMIPVIEFAEAEYFKVLNGSTVLFKPNEWRGTTGGALLPPFMLNASAFAALINGYPPGTVTHIYMTSDGGAKLTDFYDLAALLDEHVVIVNPNDLGELAVQSRGNHHVPSGITNTTVSS